MFKFLILIVALGGAMVFFANRGTHVELLQEANTNAILERIAQNPAADVFRDFATLPDYDRALVEARCQEVYEEQQRLEGTRDVLPPGLEPGCQSLLHGGWFPGWTIADGIRHLRDR